MKRKISAFETSVKEKVEEKKKALIMEETAEEGNVMKPYACSL